MITLAQIDDIKDIIKLSNEVFVSSFSEADISFFIKQKQTFFVYVIKEELEFVGFIILWINDNNGQIIDLAIKENKRRLNYGRKLVEFSLDFFKQNEVKLVSLEVRVSNIAAIKLYEAFNFKVERTLSNYYKTEDGLFMMRSL